MDDDAAEAVVQAAVESTLDEARRQADRIIAQAVEQGLQIVTEARQKAEALNSSGSSGTARSLEDIEAELLGGLDRVERQLAQRTEALMLRLAASGGEVEVTELDRWGPPGHLDADADAVVVATNGSSVHAAGDVVIDHEDLVARVGEREIPLTPVQVRILEVLMAHPGQVVHRSTLLQRVWGTENPLFNSAVERQVELLQKELQADPAGPRWITVTGVGYRYLGPPVEGVSQTERTQ